MVTFLGFIGFGGGVSISHRFTFSGFLLGGIPHIGSNLPCAPSSVAIDAYWVLDLILYGAFVCTHLSSPIGFKNTLQRILAGYIVLMNPAFQEIS
ncbi:hypothetical protein TNCV_3501231 [Trichonephila clavipes]|nr:hypothetical protein TNCV_3501231 [Trichonephila clavipes]